MAHVKKQPDLFSGTLSANGATLGFESTLWAIADRLRGQMEVSQYKHLILGLLFLRLLSENAGSHSARKRTQTSSRHVSRPAQHRSVPADVFEVPDAASWGTLVANATPKNIPRLLDRAMQALEECNDTLRGALFKEYVRSGLNAERLFDVFRELAQLDIAEHKTNSLDVLGRVYEYFLGQFARAEGAKGGEYYTPKCVVQLLVEMLAPYKGSVYDPCCGSGGMFVQSERFVAEHGGRRGDINLFGQESNPATWRLAKMNLAIHGLHANVGSYSADTFQNPLHEALEADYIIANPPFNMKDWGGELLRHDPRWKYGMPPTGNANYAWIQHFVHHLATTGVAGFVLANGSLASNTSGEGDIRARLIEDDVVECIVALPGHLFYSTQIPASLWFFTKSKSAGCGVNGHSLRDRSGEVLFIDARDFGLMIDRVHRSLTSAEIERIADVYHRWRGDRVGSYQDIPGFCRAVTLKDIRDHKFALVPGRYVGFDRSQQNIVSFSDLKDEMQAIETTLHSVTASAGHAITLIRDLLNG